MNPIPRRRFSVVFISVLGLALSGGLLLGGRPAQAQTPTLSIVSATVSCTGVSVTYSVTGFSAEATATLIALSGTSTIGAASGPAFPDGSYTVAFAVTPQPPTTPIFVEVIIGPAFASSSPTPCSGAPAPGGGGGVWPGYSDGRLNPDPAEYYSVWCSMNQIEVWRNVPSPMLVGVFPILAVLRLPVGGTLNANDMTLARASEDTITISGGNGNLAPAAGSKAFSLAECIARNGGLPPEPPGAAAPPADNSPPAPDVDFCFTLSVPADILGCLASQTLSSLELIFLWLYSCLLPPLSMVATGGFWWRRRRRTPSLAVTRSDPHA